MSEDSGFEAGEITELLSGIGGGDADVQERLFNLIYDDLHRMAAAQLRKRPERSLCPTELVGEAYLRLVQQRFASVSDRTHFFSIAARVLRRVLVDHARARLAQKRGGDARQQVTSTLVDGRLLHAEFDALDMLALEEALNELGEMSERRASVVELRYFAGLSVAETAEAMGVAEITVKRQWKFCQAWLCARIAGDSRRDGRP